MALTTIGCTQLKANPAAGGSRLHIDIPVKLTSAKWVINADQALINTPMQEPVVFTWLFRSAPFLKQWQADYRVIVIAHGPADYFVLKDPQRNPYIEKVRQLQALGVDFEVCGYTMELNHLGNDDLLPGVKVNTGAILRLAELYREGYQIIQP